MKKITKGFTLIELILFIVILSIAATATLLAFQTILTASPNAERETVAVELAQGRMELLMGQYFRNGFNNFSDPCPGAAVCLGVSGYTVSSSLVVSGNTETITVTVTGPGGTSVILPAPPLTQ